MDLGLQGKVALVAASSKGLGRAIASELAAEGARVMISGRTEEMLSRAVAEIEEKTGSEVRYRVADLAREEDVRGLVNSVVEQFGGVDVLVNNSGGPPAGGFDDLLACVLTRELLSALYEELRYSLGTPSRI